MIAAYFHLINRKAAENLGVKLKPLVNFLYNRWYIDHIYDVLITGTLWVLGKTLALIDTWVVDMAVNIVGFIPCSLPAICPSSPFKRGMLQKYAAFMVAGMAAYGVLVLYFMFKPQ